MIFLANFSNTKIDEMMEWEVTKINYWFHEAYKLYQKMNKSE